MEYLERGVVVYEVV